MKSFAGLILLGTSISLSTAAPILPALERSVSTSRQFIVYGTNPQLRGAIAETAEQLKADTLSILRQPDSWTTPIVINLQFPQANLPDIPNAELHFSQTGSGLKLQVDLVINNDIRTPRVQREIMRALLLERIYRAEQNLASGTAYVQPPDWLLEGLLAAAPGQDRASLVNAISSLVASNSTSLADFLQQRPDLLDSSARQLYRACSLALVQVFIAQSNGTPRLGRYIDNLRNSPNDQLTAVQAEFQGVTPSDLDKLWRANLRQLGTGLRFELLSFAETERRLAEILKIKVVDGKSQKTVRIEDLLQGKLSRSQKAALSVAADNLAVLGLTANPLMRPVAGEYQQIAQLMVAGKRNGLSKRLARLSSTRSRLVARMESVDDYLNWFEATQMQTKSDVFADYLRAAAEHEMPVSRRRDAISVYLDSLEQQMGN